MKIVKTTEELVAAKETVILSDEFTTMEMTHNAACIYEMFAIDEDKYDDEEIHFQAKRVLWNAVCFIMIESISQFTDGDEKDVFIADMICRIEHAAKNTHGTFTAHIIQESAQEMHKEFDKQQNNIKETK